jgi:hypothetical protein
MAEYDVDVDHGCHIGVPGSNECAALSRRGVIPEAAAISSALQLDHIDSLDMTRR